MKCFKCQTQNPEDNRFCRECGEKLGSVCPQCGAELFPEDKFCGKCGHDLEESKEIPPVDLKQPKSYTPKFCQIQISH